MKPKLKPPGTKCLKLTHDKLLSSFAFKFNLRRYTWVMPFTLHALRSGAMVGRCRLPLSKSL
jgi:hypothetical protein